jgi:hypothetical protein
MFYSEGNDISHNSKRDYIRYLAQCQDAFLTISIHAGDIPLSIQEIKMHRSYTLPAIRALYMPDVAYITAIAPYIGQIHSFTQSQGSQKRLFICELLINKC